MSNKDFPQENITENDLFYVCYMIERLARKLNQPKSYVVTTLGEKELHRLLTLASVLHSENPLKVEDELIAHFNLKKGIYNVYAVRPELNVHVPSSTQMGKVYKRLILNTLKNDENWIQAMIRIYNSPICKTLDNYNTSAFYEPAPVIAQAFLNGGF